MSEAWRTQASCRFVPVEQMFPNEQNKVAWSDLKEMCNSFCPVKQECLAFADSIENTYKGTHGMYGGLTPSERIARRRGEVLKQVACHTPGRKASVALHHKLGTPLCEACERWAANREDEQQRWERAREVIRAGVSDHRICWMAGVHKRTVKRLRAGVLDASISG